MSEPNPAVTVLMPVYNGEAFLRDAMDSVLMQTFDDFELLVIDDGSMDASSQIVEAYLDKRVRLERNEKNLNQPRSLNKGIQLARGAYIARMDCDDICHPDRLRQQVTFLEAHEDVAIVGTWAKLVGGQRDEVWRLPTNPSKVEAELIFHSTLIHPSVLIRKEVLINQDLAYDENLAHGAEDWDLWQRCRQHGRLANIPAVLLEYRTKAPSKNVDVKKWKDAETVIRRGLQRLGLDPSDEEIDLHRRIGFGEFVGEEPSFLDSAEEWLLRLEQFNRGTNLYPIDSFGEVLSDTWLRLCYFSSGAARKRLRRYLRSPLRRFKFSYIAKAFEQGARAFSTRSMSR